MWDHVMLSKYNGRRTNIALAPALHERVDHQAEERASEHFQAL
jgi:hypothetical protein